MSKRDSSGAKDGRRTSRIRKLVKWVSRGLEHIVSSPHDPPHSSETVGSEINPGALHLPKEDWVVEMDVRYGDVEYEFAEENGELRLERVEND